MNVEIYITSDCKYEWRLFWGYNREPRLMMISAEFDTYDKAMENWELFQRVVPFATVPGRV